MFVGTSQSPGPALQALVPARTEAARAPRRRPLADLLHPGGTLALLCLLLPAVILCAVASFRWPLIHDAQLMDYIAWRITSGEVPYRDIFDINMPATYLIHVGVLWLFGSGDLGWRSFDFLWLTATAGALYCFGRPISRWGALLSGIFFFAWHLSQGALSLGQRDFLLCLFLILAAHFVARSVEAGGNRSFAFWAGALLGLGASMKPYVAIYAALALVVMVSYLWREGKPQRMGAAGVFLAGAAVAPVLICVWLDLAGGLHPLFQMVVQYLIPYYSKLGRISTAALAWQLLKPNLFWALVAAIPWERSPHGPRYALGTLGVVYGVLHYALPARDWWYHEYPFHLFFFVMIAMSLASLLSRPKAKSRVCALLCLLLCEYPLALSNYRVAREPMSGSEVLDKKRVLDSLVAYLRPRVDRRLDTIQTMDTVGGGVNALFVLRVRSATRFVTDLGLFSLVNEPVVRDMQAQFMEEARANAPKYVVLFRFSWPATGYGRFRDFPEFCQWLDQSYVKDYEQPTYQIFRRRSALPPP